MMPVAPIGLRVHRAAGEVAYDQHMTQGSECSGKSRPMGCTEPAGEVAYDQHTTQGFGIAVASQGQWVHRATRGSGIRPAYDAGFRNAVAKSRPMGAQSREGKVTAYDQHMTLGVPECSGKSKADGCREPQGKWHRMQGSKCSGNSGPRKLLSTLTSGLVTDWKL